MKMLTPTAAIVMLTLAFSPLTQPKLPGEGGTSPFAARHDARLEDTYACSSFGGSDSTEDVSDENTCFDSYAQGDFITLEREREFIITIGRMPVTDSELCDVYTACDGPEPGPVIVPRKERLWPSE